MKLAEQLPADRDSEAQLLGSLLIEPARISEAARIVRPPAITDESHRLAFATLCEMQRTGQPIDVVTVRQALDAGGGFRQLLPPDETTAGYLAMLGHCVATSANWKHHAERVAEADRKRRLWRLASHAAEAALNGRASTEIFADLESSLDDFRRDGSSKGSIEALTWGDLATQHPKLREPVIDGLLRRGETMNLIADPKVGKSWAAYGLALSIINGWDWLGRFPTQRGRVLLIDNELHPSNLRYRLDAVAEAMGVFPADCHNWLTIWSLRGQLRSMPELERDIDQIEPGEFALVIVDARYRMEAAGVSENDNAAARDFYNLADAYAVKTDAPWLFVHHASKGSQSDKRVTDVGAGAGSQSRAADCHAVLRQHEEEGVYVLDAVVRSFPPVEPVPLRWTFPLWLPDGSADPRKLKGKQNSRDRLQGEKDREGMRAIVDALMNERATARQLRAKTGMGKDRQQRLLDMLELEGQITSETIIVRGNECKEYRIPESQLQDVV